MFAGGSLVKLINLKCNHWNRNCCPLKISIMAWSSMMVIKKVGGTRRAFLILSWLWSLKNMHILLWPWLLVTSMIKRNSSSCMIHLSCESTLARMFAYTQWGVTLVVCVEETCQCSLPGCSMISTFPLRATPYILNEEHEAFLTIVLISLYRKVWILL